MQPYLKALVVLAATLFSLTPSALAIAAADDTGWIGVQLGSPSAALAAQLQLEDVGMVVDNVVRDSPADRAGLQQWDVIIAIDREPVGTSIADFAKTIRQKGASATVTLKLLRGGREQTATATLGSRPADMPIDKWKYELGPSDIIHEHFQNRGHVMFQDEDGKWITKDFTTGLESLEDLPERLRFAMPHLGMTRVFRGDEQETVEISVVKNGEKIDISRASGGPITVRRSEDGNDASVSEDVYDDMDALKLGDEEAYKMLKDATMHNDGTLNTWYFGGADAPHMRLGIKKYVEALEDDMKQHDIDVWIDSDAVVSPTGPKRRIMIGGQPGAKTHVMAFTAEKEARLSFRVTDEGSIEVIKRRGTDELVEVYSSEKDLQTRSPKLHERYKALVADPDEPRE